MVNKRQSVVKTIRLTNELNEYLSREAKNTNQTVSSLTTEILTSYRERYSYVDKLNPVALLPTTLSLILETIEDSELIRLGPIIAHELCMYIEHVLGEGGGSERYDWCVSWLLPSSHWFSCFRSDGGYMITHQMGRKWGIFLTSFRSSLVEMQTGVRADLVVDGGVIVLPSDVKGLVGNVLRGRSEGGRY